MSKTSRRLLISAALTGFVVGTTSALTAAPAPGAPAMGNVNNTAKKAAKHCCAGKNACKGQGGCGANKGKNDCKGQGGCSTKTSCKGQPCTD